MPRAIIQLSVRVARSPSSVGFTLVLGHFEPQGLQLREAVEGRQTDLGMSRFDSTAASYGSSLVIIVSRANPQVMLLSRDMAFIFALEETASFRLVCCCLT